MKHFNTLAELNEELEFNCEWLDFEDLEDLLNFTRSCRTLQEVFEKCPMVWRPSMLINGYLQFIDHCPWEKLSSENRWWILSEQPTLIDRCPLETLDGENWAWLLRHYPHLIDRCPTEKLSSEDWSWILLRKPHLIDHCPIEKFVAVVGGGF